MKVLGIIATIIICCTISTLLGVVVYTIYKMKKFFQPPKTAKPMLSIKQMQEIEDDIYDFLEYHNIPLNSSINDIAKIMRIDYPKAKTRKETTELANRCAYLVESEYCDYYSTEYTARALVMPIESIASEIEHNDYDILDVDAKINFVRSLCTKYKIDELSALKRIAEVILIKSDDSNNDNEDGDE